MPTHYTDTLRRAEAHDDINERSEAIRYYIGCPTMAMVSLSLTQHTPIHSLVRSQREMESTFNSMWHCSAIQFGRLAYLPRLSVAAAAIPGEKKNKNESSRMRLYFVVAVVSLSSVSEN